MPRAYTDGPHGQMHYIDEGQGEVLLLLHQTASDSTMWERAMPRLVERYRVVAPDNSGFGLSDPPPEGASIGDYVDGILAVLDTLEIESAHAVGFHTGATIAIEMAVRNPKRLRSAVLAGVLAIKSDEEREHWRDLIVNPWELDGQGEFLDKHLEFLTQFLPEDDGELFLAELLARLQAGPNYWWAYEAILKHPTYELLAQLSQPILVLNAVDDVLYDDTKRLHGEMPDAAYAEMPGGVVSALDHPDEFAGVVLGFVDGLSSPPEAKA